jgi:hypothetical protein
MSSESESTQKTPKAAAVPSKTLKKKTGVSEFEERVWSKFNEICDEESKDCQSDVKKESNDPDELFAKSIALDMKKYDEKTKQLIKFHIQSIMLRASMGQLGPNTTDMSCNANFNVQQTSNMSTARPATIPNIPFFPYFPLATQQRRTTPTMPVTTSMAIGVSNPGFALIQQPLHNQNFVHRLSTDMTRLLPTFDVSQCLRPSTQSSQVLLPSSGTIMSNELVNRMPGHSFLWPHTAQQVDQTASETSQSGGKNQDFSSCEDLLSSDVLQSAMSCVNEHE